MRPARFERATYRLCNCRPRGSRYYQPGTYECDQPHVSHSRVTSAPWAEQTGSLAPTDEKRRNRESPWRWSGLATVESRLGPRHGDRVTLCAPTNVPVRTARQCLQYPHPRIVKGGASGTGRESRPRARRSDRAGPALPQYRVVGRRPSSHARQARPCRADGLQGHAARGSRRQLPSGFSGRRPRAPQYSASRSRISRPLR